MGRHLSELSIFAIQLGSAAVLIAIAMPLALRRVPPNLFYGVRLRSTLRDEQVWYEINARCGRHFAWLGVAYAGTLVVAFAFGRFWPALIRLLGPTALLVIALLVDTIYLARAASRLQKSGSAPRRTGLDIT